MPKPPTSVRSIRLPDEQWAALGELAKARGMTINSAVAEAVARVLSPTATGMVKDAPEAAPSVANAPLTPGPRISVAVPFAGTFKRPVYQKGTKK